MYTRKVETWSRQRLITEQAEMEGWKKTAKINWLFELPWKEIWPYKLAYHPSPGRGDWMTHSRRTEGSSSHTGNSHLVQQCLPGRSDTDRDWCRPGNDIMLLSWSFRKMSPEQWHLHRHFQRPWTFWRRRQKKRIIIAASSGVVDQAINGVSSSRRRLAAMGHQYGLFLWRCAVKLVVRVSFLACIAVFLLLVCLNRSKSLTYSIEESIQASITYAPGDNRRVF